MSEIIVHHLEQSRSQRVLWILEELGRPFSLEDRELFTGASIGITGYPEDSDDPDMLLRNADSAMYQAKDAGRNTFRFFTPEMNIRLLKRLEMESQLRYAMSKQELSLYFQPQVDIKSGRLVVIGSMEKNVIRSNLNRQ